MSSRRVFSTRSGLPPSKVSILAVIDTPPRSESAALEAARGRRSGRHSVPSPNPRSGDHPRRGQSSSPFQRTRPRTSTAWRRVRRAGRGGSWGQGRGRFLRPAVRADGGSRGAGPREVGALPPARGSSGAGRAQQAESGDRHGQQRGEYPPDHPTCTFRALLTCILVVLYTKSWKS